MSIVYSLCCFKGSTGATATMSIATPCVVTLTMHGVVTGLPVVFTTTGVLPTGVVSGTTYYARYVNANTFQLYDTEEHAFDTTSTTGRVNTSGSQSGVHTIWSAFWHNLSTTERIRYGTAGSERVYAGFNAWRTARAASTGATLTEVIEIADAFEETETGFTAITYANFTAYALKITTLVNGERFSGFHRGRVTRGYVLTQSGSGGYYSVIEINRANVEIDGIRVVAPNQSSYAIRMRSTGFQTVKNCIAKAAGYAAFCLQGTASRYYNNIAYESAYGFQFISYGMNFCIAYNNLAVKCTIFGMQANGSPVYGNYYNNVSIGNATNWSSAPSNPNDGGMRNNVGETGNTPWGTNAITTLTTAHFVDWANNDFRYTPDSPLIDAGMDLVDGDPSDILGALRPNYSAGNAASDEWDCGPFEYDSGHGLPPVLCVFSLTGIPTGSEIRLYENNHTPGILGTEIEGTENWIGGTYEYEYAYSGTNINIVVQIISDDYEESITYYTLGGTSQTILIVLTQEENV